MNIKQVIGLNIANVQYHTQGEKWSFKFLKVDVDECEEVAMDNEISAMPTFKFFKGGNVVDELVGANPDKLKEIIDANER